MLEVSRRQQQREQGGEDYPNIEAHREEPLAPEHWELRLAVQTQIVSMAGVRLECRKSIELSPGNLRLSPRTFQAYRDSSLPKLKPRVHFLLMRATVRQDAEPCWRPGTSLTHNRM